MISALVDQRTAAAAAFEHDHIAPLTVIDAHDVSALNQPLKLALATPRYANQDPITCISISHVPLQVLTNDAPYRMRRRNVLQMLCEIMLHGHLRILQSSSGIISDDLVNLVRRCWARNPIDRPSKRSRGCTCKLLMFRSTD